MDYSVLSNNKLIEIFLKNENRKIKEEVFEIVYKRFSPEQIENLFYNKLNYWGKIRKIKGLLLSSFEDLRNEVFSQLIMQSDYDWHNKDFEDWFFNTAKQKLWDEIYNCKHRILEELDSACEIFMEYSLKDFQEISDQLPFYYKVTVEMYSRVISIIKDDISNEDEKFLIIFYYIFNVPLDEIKNILKVSIDIQQLYLNSETTLLKKMIKDKIHHFALIIDETAKLSEEPNIENILNDEEKEIFNLRTVANKPYSKIIRILKIPDLNYAKDKILKIFKKIICLDKKIPDFDLIGDEKIKNIINLEKTLLNKDLSYDSEEFPVLQNLAILRNMFFLEEKFKSVGEYFKFILSDENLRKEFKEKSNLSDEDIDNLLEDKIKIPQEILDKYISFLGLTRGYLARLRQ